MPFIANSNTSQLEETKDVSLKESQIVSLTTTSPVPGVPVSDFITLGKKVYNDNDNYGYYKNTVEWPVGSGNRLTTLLKWDIHVISQIQLLLQLQEAQALHSLIS